MARRWFGPLAALTGLVLATGCCSWCERHCPHPQACAPACYPVQPCCPPPCTPAGYTPAAAPATSWNNPTGCPPVAPGH